MIKKVFCMLVAFLFTIGCFADSLDDEVDKALSFLIPADNSIIEVETPYYDETLAASEFSGYLKKIIESTLSSCGKEVFDFARNSEADSKIADYSDSGYSIGKSARIAQRKMPDGTLSASFSEKNNEVVIFFEYAPFIGNKKTKKVKVSTKNLPGLQYQPENYQLAKEVYLDTKMAGNIAKRSPETTLTISASMLDINENPVDILYPDSKVHFQIGAPEKDVYISILNISAEGKKFWLIKNKLIPAGESWKSPNFKPVDNVFGMETIYIYASSSPKGLPTNEDSDTQYLPGTITSITRELMLDLSDDEVSTGTFALTYTVLPNSVE